MDLLSYQEARIMQERRERRRRAREERLAAEELGDLQEKLAMQQREEARRIRGMQRRARAVEMREAERAKFFAMKHAEEEAEQLRQQQLLAEKLEEEEDYFIRKEELLQQKVEFEAAKEARRQTIVRRKRNLEAAQHREAEEALDEKIQILEEIKQEREEMFSEQRRTKMMERLEKWDEVQERQEAVLEAKRLRAKEKVRAHARRVLELRERQRRLHETVTTSTGEVMLVPTKHGEELSDEESPFSPTSYDPSMSYADRSLSYTRTSRHMGSPPFHASRLGANGSSSSSIRGDQSSNVSRSQAGDYDDSRGAENGGTHTQYVDDYNSEQSWAGEQQQQQRQQQQQQQPRQRRRQPQEAKRPRPRPNLAAARRDSYDSRAGQSQQGGGAAAGADGASQPADTASTQAAAAAAAAPVSAAASDIYAQIEALKRERLALMEEENKRLAEEEELLLSARMERSRIQERLDARGGGAAAAATDSAAASTAYSNGAADAAVAAYDQQDLQNDNEMDEEALLEQEDRDFDRLAEGTPVTILPASRLESPRRVVLALNEDSGRWIVQWRDRRDQHVVGERIDLGDCQLSEGVNAGLFTDSMYQARYESVAALCFSLQLPEGASLDVICTHDEDYEVWKRVLNVLLP